MCVRVCARVCAHVRACRMHDGSEFSVCGGNFGAFVTEGTKGIKFGSQTQVNHTHSLNESLEERFGSN